MEDPVLPVSSFAVDEVESATSASAVDVDAAVSPCSSASLSASAVLVRLSSVVLLACISLWANYEASKGFELTVLNGAAGTDAGRKFDLVFVSNDRASRVVLDASRSVESVLYPGSAADAEPKKPVAHVTLRLSDGNLSSSVVVLPRGQNEFLLHVSSAVMVAADAYAAMRRAVNRGMARVWLWDGQGTAPEGLLDAMAEYLAVSAGLDGATGHDPLGSGGAAARMEGEEESWCQPAATEVGNDSRDTAVSFVRFCEAKSRGFVARLNRAMRGRWRPNMVEEALGSPLGQLCRRHRTPAGGGGEAAPPVGDGRQGRSPRGRHVTWQDRASE